MPDNEKKSNPQIENSEKLFNLMSTNELLIAYDSNKEFHNTKMKIRQEILRRMKEGAIKNQK